MNIIKRNNIKISGQGQRIIIFAHGYGCSQHMWRLVTPALEANFKIILYDHVGSGDSDSAFYDKVKYGTLNGYAEDIIEILTLLEVSKVYFVGHSVSGMMGVLAAKKRPDLFEKLLLVTPSPCYINQDSYTGGFTKDEIDGLLNSLENNFIQWSKAIAPVISGNHLKVAEELALSFCSIRPEIAKHFAQVTFLSDNRKDLIGLEVPTVIFQCTDDAIAPAVVGQFIHEQIPHSTLIKLRAQGHCPQLTDPLELIDALFTYL